MLSEETFKAIVASTPLISIDLIVRDNQNNILLGKRVNRPAKDYWFVPGGRVLKDESIEQAFKRLLELELGIANADPTFKGIYQHFYDDNFSEDDFTTHYVVLAYEINFNGNIDYLPDVQHNDYQWFSEKSLLNNIDVHKHTKWYFQIDKQADSLMTNIKVKNK